MKTWSGDERKEPQFRCPNCKRQVYELYDVDGVAAWRVCGDCANIIQKQMTGASGR
jgi:hypothetical protein